MRKLLEFHRSPNSVKVRIGLNAKGLAYETEEMMAADREPMLEAAGWPLVPILLDGDVVMRESAAILQYLEANYRHGPSLTPSTRDDIKTAETIVMRLDPEILAIQWRLSPEIEKDEQDRDLDRIEEARRDLSAALARLETRLDGRAWLVGEAMSLYDVILASNLLPARAPASFAEESPIWRFFDRHFRLSPDRPAVAAWMDRVLAHDGLEGDES